MNTLFNLLPFILFLLPVIAYSASFEPMRKEIIRAEGTAFTITRFDKGGATKYGVTKSTWFGWCNHIDLRPCDRNKNGKEDDYDIALITLNDAFLIYKKGYWDTWRCDGIENQQIAEMLCDWNINQGLGKNRRYVKIVQQVVGYPVLDGRVSDKLIQYINKMDVHKFLFEITKKRLSLYDDIIKNNPSQLVFKKSWYNRTVFILKKYERINNLPSSIGWCVLSPQEKRNIHALQNRKR